MVRALLVWAMVCASSGRAEEYSYLKQYQPQAGKDHELKLDGYFEKHPLTLVEVTRIARRARTYEAFLDALQKRAGYLFDHYVLLHGTGSLQPATLAAPRVVLFGDGLLLAFAKNLEVEILAFNPKTRAFRTAEVHFGTKRARVALDPPVCQLCHGQDSKALWDPYDFWPIAFGSAISRMHSTEERDAYLALFKEKREGGILARLKDRSGPESEYYKLDNVEAFTLYTSVLNFARANPKMGEIFTALGDRKHALFAALSRCADGTERATSSWGFDDFFPKDVWDDAGTPYATILKDTHAARRAFKAGLLRRYGRTFGKYTEYFGMDQKRLEAEATIAAQLRFVLENTGLGMDWVPMSTGANRYFLSTPSNFGYDWLTVLGDVDPDGIGKAGGGSGWVAITCDAARKLAYAAMKDQKWSRTRFPVVLPTPPVFGRCIECHANPTGKTPRIPFDDTMELRAMFGKAPRLAKAIAQRIRATDSTRMPPERQLCAEEVANFDTALARLTDE